MCTFRYKHCFKSFVLGGIQDNNATLKHELYSKKSSLKKKVTYKMFHN